MRHYTDLQKDLAANYCKLAAVSTDPPEVSNAFRTGLEATYTFLCDHERHAIKQLDMIEVTPPEFKYGLLALPFTFSLLPDLTIHNIYDGWWAVGRPTLEELRQDLRVMMQICQKEAYAYTGPTLAESGRSEATV